MGFSADHKGLCGVVVLSRVGGGVGVGGGGGGGGGVWGGGDVGGGGAGKRFETTTEPVERM